MQAAGADKIFIIEMLSMLASQRRRRHCRGLIYAAGQLSAYLRWLRSLAKGDQDAGNA